MGLTIGELAAAASRGWNRAVSVEQIVQAELHGVLYPAARWRVCKALGLDQREIWPEWIRRYY